MQRKTVKAKVVELTAKKESILEQEWREWHSLLESYRRLKFQDALWLYESPYHAVKTSHRHASYVTQVVKKNVSPQSPLLLRNDCFKVEKQETELVSFWARIPTKQREGGVWIPIAVPYRYHDTLQEAEIKDSKLCKKNGEFWVHITIEKETPELYTPRGVLAVDLGARWLGVGVCGADNKPLFIGKKIRTIRGKYHKLRRQTPQEVHGDKEKRKVDYWLHTTAKWIAEFAAGNGLAVVVGDVKNVAGETGKGRRFNRYVNQMAVHKLKQYLSYKCIERGVPFVVVDEAYTTQTCSRCAYREERPETKQFNCGSCGLQMHADRNAAVNIKQRGLDKLDIQPLSRSGALLAVPETPEADIVYAKKS